MLQDVGHILKDETARTLNAENLVYFEEEVALEGISEAHLVACLGERLARKTRSKHVVVRDLAFYVSIGLKVVDVTPGMNSIVRLVEGVKRRLPLGSEHNFAIEVIESDMETSEARKKVDELEGWCCGCHIASLPGRSCRCPARVGALAPAVSTSLSAPTDNPEVDMQ
jgi:hypothetical protein